MASLDERRALRGQGPAAKEAVERLRKLAMRATAGPPPFEWLYGVRIDVFVDVATQALHSADDRGHARSIIMRAPDVLAHIQRDIATNAHQSSVVSQRYRRLAQLLWADRIRLSEVDGALRDIVHADDHHRVGGDVAVSAANETDAQPTWRQSAVNLTAAASAAYALGYFAIILFTVYAAASRTPGVSSLPSSVRLSLVSLLALPQGLAGPLVEAGLSRVVPSTLAGVASRNLFASFAVASLASAASYVILWRLTQLATDSTVNATQLLFRRAYTRVVGAKSVDDALQVVETSRTDLATIERAVSAEVRRARHRRRPLTNSPLRYSGYVNYLLLSLYLHNTLRRARASLFRLTRAPPTVSSQLQSIDIEKIVNQRAKKLIEARLDVARGDIRVATEKAQVAILEARMRQTSMVEESVKLRVDRLLGGVLERIEELDQATLDLAEAVTDQSERVEQMASSAALGELMSMAKLGTLERIGDVQQLVSVGRNALAAET